MSVFRDGVLDPTAGGEPLASVLARACDRGGSHIRPADLIAAVLEDADADIDAALRAAMAPGAIPRDLLDAIDIYAPASLSVTAFDGRRERFSAQALAALERLQTRLSGGGRGNVATPLLLSCVLEHLTDDDRSGLLRIFDAGAAGEGLERLIDVDGGDPPPPLLDRRSGRLRAEELSSAVWSVLEQAAAHAGRLGYGQLLAPHCLLALLGETEGPAERVVRLEGRAGVGPVEVATAIEEGFRLAATGGAPIELERHAIGEPALALLAQAQRRARLAADDRIETHHLLVALLDGPPPRLRSVLESGALRLDVARMRRNAAELGQDRNGDGRDPPFRLPAGLLPSEDLTHDARHDELTPALHVERYLEPMLRALSRRTQNHVLVTAPGGVGATSLVREIARQAAAGTIRAVARKRFLRVDCAAVAPEESREKLAAVLAHVGGRSDVILCLDSLGALLRGPDRVNHVPALRAALASGQAQVVAVMAPTDHRDLLAGDSAIAELFTRIELEEPTSEEASEIVALRARELETEYGVTIEPAAVTRSVALTDAYLLSERLPAKALRVLRRACEDADYAREQDDPADVVTATDVARVVAELTGMPLAALDGIVRGVDYERALGAAVVGQPEAVRAVASELRSIKSGIVDSGRPAAVMLFAGLTGVGKTELAKALGSMYSASQRLRTYTMANFTEPHSVSGIVGVPAGFHGHDLGGPLINDLNADPYCVVLLDEAEKAHPDVWKPFLNLFDEGWIVDLRGIKAYADRAMFVLASNVGHETIARMSADGASPEQIAPLVREALGAHRHARTGELVFPPELLARIGRIIVFRPLDEAAMTEICRLGIGRVSALWRRREKALAVAPQVVEHIATEAHQRDKASRHTEGGRVVRRLIDELIQARITEAIDADPERAGAAGVIEVTMAPPGDDPPPIRVSFIGGDDG